MAAEPTTPMMVQYRKLKNRHRDAILFFRLGDFYEMFGADAKEASELLEIALTRRNGVPMCGVPHHSARSYVARLLKAGRRVAVCEQTSLPSAGKGIARREVVEVVTPGTVLDEELLDGGSNNFLVAVGSAPHRGDGKRSGERWVAVAALDLSTGEFRATAFPLADAAARVADELARLAPRELLVQESLLDDAPPVARSIHQHIPRSAVVQRYPDWQFDVAAGSETLCELFGVTNLKAFGLRPDAPELAPAGLLVNFARQTARHGLVHLEGINVYGRESFVTLDESAQRNLELVRNLEDGSRERTLLAMLDHTRTPMGARLLRRAILEPLCDRTAIRERLDAVEALFRRQSLLAAVRERLRQVSDIERLAGRVALSRAHPRDLRAIADSVRAAEDVARMLNARDGESAGGPAVAPLAQPLAAATAAVEPVAAVVEQAIVNEPPLSMSDGGIFRPGYDAELDRVRAVAEDAESLLGSYLEEERARSGITTLRLRHNRVLGRYLEVTRAPGGPGSEPFRAQAIPGRWRTFYDRATGTA